MGLICTLKINGFNARVGRVTIDHRWGPDAISFPSLAFFTHMLRRGRFGLWKANIIKLTSLRPVMQFNG